MSDFSFLRLEDTSLGRLQAEITSMGFDPAAVLHIAATSSIASSLLSAGLPSIPIGAVIDSLTLTSVSCSLPIPVSAVPNGSEWNADTPSQFKESVRQFQRAVRQRDFRVRAAFSQALRDYWLDNPCDEVTELRRNVDDLARTVRRLNDMDIRPASLNAHSPISKVALDFLVSIRDPGLFFGDRIALWEALDDADSFDELRELLGQISPLRDFEVVILHGFHFYTPIQFAFFEFLRKLKNLHVIFIIHDDRANPAFENWRAFFDTDQWLQGKPLPSLAVSPPSLRSVGIVAAFQGGREFAIDNEKVTLIKFSSKVALSQYVVENRSLAADTDNVQPMVFAPDASSLNRSLSRLIGDPADTKPQLSNLPVGIFLSTIHKSVIFDAQSRAGRVSLKVEDCKVALELLVPAEARKSVNLSAMLAYFTGCESISDWEERHLQLKELRQHCLLNIPNDADKLGSFQNLNNPLILLPWLSCSDSDFSSFSNGLNVILAIIAEMSIQPRQAGARYAEWLDNKLKALPLALSETLRQDLERSFSVLRLSGQDKYDLVGLAELVTASLSLEVTDDAFELLDETRWVYPLAQLDALALGNAPAQIHIANLVTELFPRNPGHSLWPFEGRDLENLESTTQRRMLDLDILRAETAALTDQYLLWLGLTAKTGSGESKVTLSYHPSSVAKATAPSSIFTLFGRMNNRHTFSAASWGLELKTLSPFPSGGATQVPISLAPAPSRINPIVLRMVPEVAKSTGAACPRRFALQWLLAPTPKHLDTHTFGILLGNIMFAQPAVREAIQSKPWFEAAWSAPLSSTAWENAKRKKVIGPNGAKAAWIWNLTGSRSGMNLSSLGYRSLLEPTQMMPTVVRGLITCEPHHVLPLPSEERIADLKNERVCNMCPVHKICAASI